MTQPIEFLTMPREPLPLAAAGNMPEAVHAFEPRQVRAINAALAARRPLLVRGEPGIGKSQLARAAAKALGRVLVLHTVDARTESRDLLWHFDAVARLAEAQLIGALERGFGPTGAAPVGDAAHAAPDAAQPTTATETQTEHANQGLPPIDTRDAVAKLLAIDRYLHPRALWWAFDWQGAAKRAEALRLPEPPRLDGGDPNKGCVVLIDEIDKAEADVPNGLLEALGAGCFQVQGSPEPVVATGIAPLVIITTNEERALPDAFVRRCLVLHLGLPNDPDALKRYLIQRGRAHFGQRAAQALLEKAAEQLIRDRDTARDNHWLPLPGQAEYLDLIRAVVESASDAAEQERLIDAVAEFVLRKHPDAYQRQLAQRADEPAA